MAKLILHFCLLVFVLNACYVETDEQKKEKNTRWFTVKSQALCDPDNGIMPDKRYERIYGHYYAFNKKQENIGDTLNIQFDILAACCLSFTGHAEIENDTLKIKYYETRGDSTKCECTCDYRMFYAIDSKDKFWSAIKIEYSL